MLAAKLHVKRRTARWVLIDRGGDAMVFILDHFTPVAKKKVILS